MNFMKLVFQEPICRISHKETSMTLFATSKYWRIGILRGHHYGTVHGCSHCVIVSSFSVYHVHCIIVSSFSVYHVLVSTVVMSP